LLEHETIEGKHVLEILQFGELRSPVITAALIKPEEKNADKKPEEKSAAEDLITPGGSAPSPSPA